jgi:hypothetical protein
MGAVTQLDGATGDGFVIGGLHRGVRAPWASLGERQHPELAEVCGLTRYRSRGRIDRPRQEFPRSVVPLPEEPKQGLVHGVSTGEGWKKHRVVLDHELHRFGERRAVRSEIIDQRDRLLAGGRWDLLYSDLLITFDGARGHRHRDVSSLQHHVTASLADTPGTGVLDPDAYEGTGLVRQTDA